MGQNVPQGVAFDELRRVLSMTESEAMSQLAQKDCTMGFKLAFSTVKNLLEEQANTKSRSKALFSRLADALFSPPPPPAGSPLQSPINFNGLNPFQVILEQQKRLESGSKPASRPAEIAAEPAD